MRMANASYEVGQATNRSAAAGWGAGLVDAARAAGPPLLFGLRLWASVCLALYVAFWLQLDNAYWAGTSAAIVCQPQLGASMRKARFRMIGTIVGAVMIVALNACFPQDRFAFLALLALWLSFCAFAATLMRNFASYAAALAGYTAAIIAADTLGATGGPDGQVFMLAVTRASEICIGIACAGIVLAGTDFGGAQRQLAEMFGDLGSEIAGRFARMLAPTGSRLADTRAQRRELARRVIALDPAVDRAIGESSQLRYHSPVLQRAVEGLFAALDGWRTVAAHLSRLPDSAAPQEAETVLSSLPLALRSAPEPAASTRWMADPVGLRDICEEGGRTLLRPAGGHAVAAPPRRSRQPRCWPGLRKRSMASPCSSMPVCLFLAIAGSGSACLIGRLVSSMADGRSSRWAQSSSSGSSPPGRTGSRPSCFRRSLSCCFRPKAIRPMLARWRSRSASPAASLPRQLSSSQCCRGSRAFPAFCLALGLCLVPVGFVMAHSRQPMVLAVVTALGFNFMPLLAPANQMSYDTAQFYNSALAIVRRLRYRATVVSAAAAALARLAGAPAPRPDLARSAPPGGWPPAAGDPKPGTAASTAASRRCRIRPNLCSARSSSRRSPSATTSCNSARSPACSISARSWTRRLPPCRSATRRGRATWLARLDHRLDSRHRSRAGRGARSSGARQHPRPLRGPCRACRLFRHAEWRHEVHRDRPLRRLRCTDLAA